MNLRFTNDNVSYTNNEEDHTMGNIDTINAINEEINTGEEADVTVLSDEVNIEDNIEVQDLGDSDLVPQVCF